MVVAYDSGLQGALRKVDKQVVDAADLSVAETEWLLERFLLEIYPILSSMPGAPAHLFSFISSQGFGLVLELENADNGDDGKLSKNNNSSLLANLL